MSVSEASSGGVQPIKDILAVVQQATVSKGAQKKYVRITGGKIETTTDKKLKSDLKTVNTFIQGILKNNPKLTSVYLNQLLKFQAKIIAKEENQLGGSVHQFFRDKKELGVTKDAIAEAKHIQQQLKSRLGLEPPILTDKAFKQVSGKTKTENRIPIPHL